MKIESLIKRKGGTVVEMDAPDRTYRFAPESGNHDDPHVAEVGVQSHARALLRIREGYRVLPGEESPEDDQQQQLKQDGQELVGSNIHAASYVIKGGDSIALGELVTMAFEDSGLDFDQWNKTTDEERYAYIDATLLELQVGVDDAAEQDPVQQEPPAPQVEQKPEPVKEEDPAQKQQDDHADAPADAPLSELSRKELAPMYQKRFGRQPSARMTIGDIAAALSEED